MSVTVESRILNGVDVGKLMETVGTLKSDPSLASLQFRVSTEWLDGAHTLTRVAGFRAAGVEQARPQPFVLEGDEPPVLLGTDKGAGAGETLLAALGQCLAVTLVYHAAARGIKVDALELAIEGDGDVQGLLDLNDRVRPGLSHIHVTARVKADAPKDTIRELWEYAQTRSPIFDTIRNPVDIGTSLEDWMPA